MGGQLTERLERLARRVPARVRLPARHPHRHSRRRRVADRFQAHADTLVHVLARRLGAPYDILHHVRRARFQRFAETLQLKVGVRFQRRQLSLGPLPCAARS